MKQSNYNFFFPVDDCVLAYNARTNALAKIKKGDFKEIEKILQDPESSDKNDLYQELMYGGFLTLDHTDELANIRHDMYAARFSTDTLGLTIAPTLNCNFRCFYCYEKDVLENKSMTDDVANKILNFIKFKIKLINFLDITWYGGEPLLEKARILSLSKSIIQICEKNKVDYSAGIVTNGYLLDCETLLKLRDCKVNTIQITLDGVAETHDKRRYLKNRGKTFDKIINNLLSLSTLYKEDKEENLPSINLRINVDKSNKNDAFELLDFITESSLSNFIAPYVAAVYDPKDIDNKYTLTANEYNKLKNQFINKCIDDGYDINYEAFYPIRINSNCGCDQINSVVIDPEGNIYKCWEEIGDMDACIGKIGDESVSNLPSCYFDYMLFDPTLDKECSGCKVLPICMGGGCPLRRSRDNVKGCGGYISELKHSIIKSYELINR